MRAVKTLVRSLQYPVKRKAHLDTRFRQVHCAASAKCALGIELLVAATSRVPCVVSERAMIVRECRSAQHTADTGTGTQRAYARNEWTVLEIPDPTLREAFVVCVERQQIIAKHHIEMRGR